MNGEYFTLGLLAVVLLATNIFWARYCLHLTNRIMSRNYFDVATAERKVTKPKVSDEPEMVFDPEDERQAENINSIFGMV